MRYRMMEVEQRKKPGSVFKQNTQVTAPIQHNNSSQLQMDMMAAQAGLGNRYVQRMLDSARQGSATLPIQAKLRVGSAQDEYEQEADRIAAQVMSMPEVAPKVQRMGEEDEEIQAKPLAATITPLVQRAALPEEEELQAKSINAGDSFEPSADFESRLASTRGGGSFLPESTRKFMERRFGADFSGVRVHKDAESAKLNREISAQAFTRGQDIYIASGKENIESSTGQQLLAHELTHVVQQTGTVQKFKFPIASVQRLMSRETLVANAGAAEGVNQPYNSLLKNLLVYEFYMAQSLSGRRVTEFVSSTNQLLDTIKADAETCLNLFKDPSAAAQSAAIHNLSNQIEQEKRALDWMGETWDENDLWVRSGQGAVEIAIVEEKMLGRKMGRFETKGEAQGFIRGVLTSPKEASKLSPDQKSAWGGGNYSESFVTDVNKLYGMESEADARKYKMELRNAYRTLSRSVALDNDHKDVARELSDLLAHDELYGVDMKYKNSIGTEKSKSVQVKLKLIIREGMPGQFLSPFEQGLTLKDIVTRSIPNPLPATIIWDPKSMFEYIVPIKDTSSFGKVLSMNPWVVLAHELGHFQDFLNDPAKYEKALRDPAEIEEWNLPREQAIVKQVLHQEPRQNYQDFPGGRNKFIIK